MIEIKFTDYTVIANEDGSIHDVLFKEDSRPMLMLGSGRFIHHMLAEIVRLRAVVDALRPTKAPPLSAEIQALIAERVAAAKATDSELDGFAMELLDQYGFRRAPDAMQPNDDPDMLDEVYFADGQTIFNLMCVLGYKRTPAGKDTSRRAIAQSDCIWARNGNAACPAKVKGDA